MPTFESTLGLCAGADSRTIDAGAGATSGALVVAHGLGGHGTGWIPARMAIRTLCQRFAAAAEASAYVGAADEFPELWGWAGALQDRASARAVYQACEALLNPRTTTDALAEALMELDRAIARIPELPLQITGPVTSCSAVRALGDRIVGAHAGIGRALLLREHSPRLESLTLEHFLREVVGRQQADADPDFILALPPNLVVGALGGLSQPGAMTGVDTFEASIALGDVLLLCSRRLPLPDAEIAARLRRARAPEESLDGVMDELVQAVLDAGDRQVHTGLAMMRRLR